MTPTLQELVEAASRDLDAKELMRRRRVRANRGPRVPEPELVRIALKTPPTLEGRNRVPQPSLASGSPRIGLRRYLAFLTFGLVVLAAGALGLAWVRASAGWRQEAREQRRELILREGMSVHAQINVLTAQADRLEDKARTLLEYSKDLRYSYHGRAGDLEFQQADAALADRRRLLVEIGSLRRKLAELRRESMALHAQP